MTIAILYHRSSSVLSYCYLYSIILYGVPYINSDVPFKKKKKKKKKKN
jgi:hypothetical protein